MIMGGMIEADRALLSYEARMRAQKRMMRDQARWARLNEEYGSDDED